MCDETPWKKRFERERQARKSAEKLLEEKTLEVWRINQGLEGRIHERTAELEKALQKANEANRAKDAFLSSMSHELRTPLNAIIGFSQILLAKKDTPEKVRDYIGKVHVAGSHLLELVNTILDFSKIEAGKMDFNPQPMHFERLFEELAIIMEPLTEKKGIRLIFDVDDGKSYVGDYQLIKQLCINLIGNAIKFSPATSSVAVRYRWADTAREHRITVVDYGIGIAESDLVKLFKPFTQIRQEETRQKGTGLGLVISRKIAQMHGGDIVVKSRVGEGSSFTVILREPMGMTT